MNIAVITGASSGLGVKFLDAIIKISQTSCKEDKHVASVPGKHGYGNESERTGKTKPKDKRPAFFEYGQADMEGIGIGGRGRKLFQIIQT